MLFCTVHLLCICFTWFSMEFELVLVIRMACSFCIRKCVRVYWSDDKIGNLEWYLTLSAELRASQLILHCLLLPVQIFVHFVSVIMFFFSVCCCLCDVLKCRIFDFFLTLLHKSSKCICHYLNLFSLCLVSFRIVSFYLKKKFFWVVLFHFKMHFGYFGIDCWTWVVIKWFLSVNFCRTVVLYFYWVVSSAFLCAKHATCQYAWIGIWRVFNLNLLVVFDRFEFRVPSIYFCAVVFYANNLWRSYLSVYADIDMFFNGFFDASRS